MSSLKAHFDGRSIVLDEPAPPTLAAGQKMRVVVTESPADNASTESPRQTRFGFARGMFEMRDDFNDPLDEFAEYR